MPLSKEDAAEIQKMIDTAAEAQAEKIASGIGNTVNSAVTAQLKRVDFGKMIGEGVSKALEPLKPALDKLQSGEGEGGEGEGQPAPKRAAGKQDPELAKLQSQLEAMKTEQARKDAETVKIREGARMKDAEAQIRQLLAGKVRPEAIGLAIDAMRARGVIAFGEDDSPVIRIPFAAMKGAKAELTDFNVEDGLAEYLKTPEAAVLLPAPSTGGTGSPRTTPGAGGKVRFNTSKPLKDWTPEERQAYLQERQDAVAEATRQNPMG